MLLSFEVAVHSHNLPEDPGPMVVVVEAARQASEIMALGGGNYTTSGGYRVQDDPDPIEPGAKVYVVAFEHVRGTG